MISFENDITDTTDLISFENDLSDTTDLISFENDITDTADLISFENDINGELRSESTSKIKISHPISFNKLSGKDLVEATDFSPGTSAELARMVSADINCKKLGVNKSRIKLGSGTKIDKFQDLLINDTLYFSTSGANKFRNIIEKGWRKLRSQQTLELHQNTEEKSCTPAELLSVLRFRDSRYKIDKSSPTSYLD